MEALYAMYLAPHKLLWSDLGIMMPAAILYWIILQEAAAGTKAFPIIFLSALKTQEFFMYGSMDNTVISAK